MHYDDKVKLLHVSIISIDFFVITNWGWGEWVSKWNWAAALFLFVWSFSSHLRIFHSYGDFTNACWGLQILTYARHSWSFCVSHLQWHGTSVYNGHLRGPVTLTLVAERLAIESSHILRLRLMSPAAGIRTPKYWLRSALNWVTTYVQNFNMFYMCSP